MTPQTEQRDDDRWRMALDRRADPNSPFVYAVRTTGIYCAPTCPARRPNRANVVFFDTAKDARKAGFRPCKRCRPDGNRRVGDG